MSKTPTGTDRVELTDARCGYTVTNIDGNEEPCDLPATGHRWYQDVGEHENLLDVACDNHRNEGGRLIASLRADLQALTAERDMLRGVVTRYEGTVIHQERRNALARLDAAESEREERVERDALSAELTRTLAVVEEQEATLDRVTALADEWTDCAYAYNQSDPLHHTYKGLANRLRAALTPEGKS